jgi:hypothetical protein
MKKKLDSKSARLFVDLPVMKAILSGVEADLSGALQNGLADSSHSQDVLQERQLPEHL